MVAVLTTVVVITVVVITVVDITAPEGGIITMPVAVTAAPWARPRGC